MKWSLLLSLLALDFASKVWAINHVPPLAWGPYPFGGIGIFEAGGITFSLNYIVNSGAAWGLFAGHASLLFAIRAVVIVALFLWGQKRLPMWLILSGAIGNAIDYCLYGHVIDFLYFTFFGWSFPIFNIADASITVGVMLLLFWPKRAIGLQVL